MRTVVKRYSDACQNLMRLNYETAQMGKDPRRNYNFSVALARQQLYLGDYDDYKETKALVNNIAKEKLGRKENNPELADLRRITEQIATYHAKRGELEKIMDLVGREIMPEGMALRVLLDNGCFSDFKYLAGKYSASDSLVENMVLYRLIDLCIEGKLREMQDMGKAGILPYNAFSTVLEFAKKAAEYQLDAKDRILAAKTLRKALEYCGSDFVRSVLGRLDYEFDQQNKKFQG